ncbi:MAG: toll/interleukin-1 receptor domain-containing protein [Acidobacteria bacterium]|nr:toll/interleukin-1 receptor domain-containing protein [Acidobacteriota bacterium]
MATTELAARDWKVLLSSLEQGRCIALVGPGLEVTLAENRIHAASLLARKLSQALAHERRVSVSDPDDLPLVAEAFLKWNSRDDLEVEVREFYEEFQKRVTLDALGDGTFTGLASLPFSTFISARHDDLLEQHLRRAGRSPVVRTYAFRGNQQRSLGSLGTPDQPLVYRLLGGFDVPGSLAVTERDLLDVLKSIASTSPGLPPDLLNELRSRSVLFLGCGLHEYYTRVLLHVLGVSNSQQRSFALESVPAYEESEVFLRRFKKGAWFYEIGYERLKVLDLDQRTFIQELSRQWQLRPSRSGSAPAASRAGDATRRPRVFISHVHEDAGRAGMIAQVLERAGIEPWIDTTGLRGGERWPLALQDAIERDVDFFLVLLSPDLTDEVETYVHLEIRQALQRSARRGTLKFIYPLQIGSTGHRLDALDRESLQVWTVTSVDEIGSDLASDIRRQFARLRRR